MKTTIVQKEKGESEAEVEAEAEAGAETGDPLTIFLYALRAPETKRQYPKRLKVFLDYLGLGGNLHEQAKQFLTKAKQNPQ